MNKTESLSTKKQKSVTYQRPFRRNDSIAGVIVMIVIFIIVALGAGRLTAIGQFLDDVVFNFLFGWFKYGLYALLVIFGFGFGIGIRIQLSWRMKLVLLLSIIMASWLTSTITIIVINSGVAQYEPYILTTVVPHYITDLWYNSSIFKTYDTFFNFNGNYWFIDGAGGLIGYAVSGIFAYTYIWVSLLIWVVIAVIILSWIIFGDAFILFKFGLLRTKTPRFHLERLTKRDRINPQRRLKKQSQKVKTATEPSQDLAAAHQAALNVNTSDITIQMPSFRHWKPTDVVNEAVAQAKSPNLEPATPVADKTVQEILDKYEVRPEQSNSNLRTEKSGSFSSGSQAKPVGEETMELRRNQFNQETELRPFNNPHHTQENSKKPPAELTDDEIYNAQYREAFARTKQSSKNNIKSFKSQLADIRSKTITKQPPKPSEAEQSKASSIYGPGVVYPHKEDKNKLRGNEGEGEFDLPTMRVESPTESQSSVSKSTKPNINSTGFEAPNFVNFDAIKASNSNPPQQQYQSKAPKVVNNYQVDQQSNNKNRQLGLPPLDLLKTPLEATKIIARNEQFATEIANKIDATFKEFSIPAGVDRINIGPAVTKYEVKLAPSTRVNKVTGLSDELKLALASNNIRLEAPIEGRSAVGIEVPNAQARIVYLSELMNNKNLPQPLAMAIGVSVMGNPIFAELTKMPHLLIAGSTGSGKSICLNVIISSLLMQNNADKLKFLLIDPKRVELITYNNLPHLLEPIITDPYRASDALHELVLEMERRYDLLASASVKNIESYNRKTTIDKLPYIVIVIDELADLMLTVGKPAEESIKRLAQMARAAGIHLVIATQRPSTDVITGVIKNNIPSRIAFAVSSAIDSRTIIDTGGAEKLIGAGDMLYAPVNLRSPLRVQGAYISEEEIEKIVKFWTTK